MTIVTAKKTFLFIYFFFAYLSSSTLYLYPDCTNGETDTFWEPVGHIESWKLKIEENNEVLMSNSKLCQRIIRQTCGMWSWESPEPTLAYIWPFIFTCLVLL